MSSGSAVTWDEVGVKKPQPDLSDCGFVFCGFEGPGVLRVNTESFSPTWFYNTIQAAVA